MIVFDNMDFNIVGLLPTFFSEADPRPAREQIHDRYAHGGGWSPFEGFKLTTSGDRYALLYPGDPPMLEITRAQLREETIVLFRCAWVAIIQPDETYEVSRVD